MELKDAIKQRRSIRKFLAKPVPEKMLHEIVSDAIWAPSWGNTQPWEMVAATGKPLEQFRKENNEAMITGKPSSPEITIPEDWPDVLTNRYRGVGKSVLSSLAIERKDVEGRNKYYSQMYSFFDAPALLMLIIDKEVALEYAMLDCGLILQNICLLAENKGLGTCILAATIHYPEIAHRIFTIPDDKRIVIGIALGWPDKDAPVNQFTRERAPMEELIRWIK